MILMEDGDNTILVETDSTHWADAVNRNIQRKGWDLFKATGLDIEDGIEAYSIAGSDEECVGIYGSIAGQNYAFDLEGNPKSELVVEWLIILPNREEEDNRIFATVTEAMLEAERLHPDLFLDLN